MVSQLPEHPHPAYAPKKPDGFPETIWLLTLQGQKYQLTFRFYGSSKDVVDGTCFPVPFVEGARPET